MSVVPGGQPSRNAHTAVISLPVLCWIGGVSRCIDVLLWPGACCWPLLSSDIDRLRGLGHLRETITNSTITVKLGSVGSINIAMHGEPLDMSQPQDDPSRIYCRDARQAHPPGQKRRVAVGEYLDVGVSLRQGITLQGGSAVIYAG